MSSTTEPSALDKGKDKETVIPVIVAPPQDAPAASPPLGSVASTASVTPSPTPTPAEGSFKLWRPPNTTSTPLQDLPDSYFEPTAAELRAAYQSQAKLRDDLINAPFRTQAARDAEEKQKLAKWPNTTIRVRFPDRTQLEKVFPSTDKIRSVYAFVRSTLNDETKPFKFVLYQSPPRREFRVSDAKVRDLSLAQLKLAPSSVLMLSFLDESLNSPSLPAPLLPSILAQAQDLPKPPAIEDVNPNESAQPKKSGGSSSSSGGGLLGDTKVPKWFKMGQKK